MNLKTLDSARLRVLRELAKIRRHGFFLAGGTAVALTYGHRMSEDFDLFRPAPFAPADMFKVLSADLPGLKMTIVDENTLNCTLNGVKLSFFGGIVDHFLPFTETEWFPVADMLDIACMKLWAMMNRETEKDYADMCVILRDHSIEDILARFQARHGDTVSVQVLLKALTFFDEITPGTVKYVDPGLDFVKVKAHIAAAVKPFVAKFF